MRAAAFAAVCLLSAAPLTAWGNKEAAEFVKRLEGFSSIAYTCASGKSTIGYGFTSTALTSRESITESEASAEAQRICRDIANKLRREMGKGNRLTSNEETAVISFIYNVGWGNFQKSTMCRLLKQGKRGGAIRSEFLRWVYVGGNRRRISKGLKLRRMREAARFCAS